MNVLILSSQFINNFLEDPAYFIALTLFVIFGFWLFWRIFQFLWSTWFSWNMVYMKVTLPRNDSKLDQEKETKKDFKEKMAIMDQLYRGIYEIRDLNIVNRILSYLFDHDTISFEMVVQDQQLNFYAVTIPYYAKLLEKQLTSLYVDAEVEILDEPYKIHRSGNYLLADYLYLDKPYWFPIKTYKQMEEDPFNSIANNLSVVDKEDSVAIQICFTPRGNKWRKKAEAEGERIFQRKNEAGLFEKIPLIGTIFSVFRLFATGKTEGNTFDSTHPGSEDGDRFVRMLQTKEENAKRIGEKANQVGFDSSIRLIVSSPNKIKANDIANSISVAFNQFKEPALNWFQNFRSTMIFPNLLRPIIYFGYKFRMVGFFQKTSLLVPEELSSIFHLPDQRYNPIPIIKWMEYKVLPAPVNTPTQGILLGYNQYRGVKKEVRIKRDDRTRHHYIIGKSGTGKSEFLFYMARQDIENGEGVCVVDPHGDLVEDLLEIIPKERAKDVIYFDPADKDRPMSLNMLEATPEQMDRVSLDAMEIFLKLFGNEIFGPRIQHYFRNACLTLMEDQEEGATIIDVPRLFVDDEFLKYKLTKVRNPVVKSFWEHEYAKTGAREKEEMIPYFSSKFGPFITNTVMRNIIGQKKSAFNFREVMDSGKILLINLSKGSIGAVNAQLLGLIVVNKINQAALSRTDVSKEKRKDFYLYVDEFQNFATDTFATILSEARKYRLSLIMAHQYINQLVVDGGYGKGQTSQIRDAVFGNVGTMSSFKVGAEDAEYLEKEYAPVLSQQDIIGIAKFKCYTKLNIDNSTSRPFSITTIFDHSGANKKLAKALKKYSRLKYGRKREFVDKEIEYRLGIEGEMPA